MRSCLIEIVGAVIFLFCMGWGFVAGLVAGILVVELISAPPLIETLLVLALPTAGLVGGGYVGVLILKYGVWKSKRW
jgi:hypothetical protein